MSLAPSEREALARIESSLRSSDPRLAARMATFTVLASRRRIPHWKCLSPWRLQIKRIIVVIIATAAAALVVLGGVFLSHLSQVPGPPRNLCGIAIDQTNSCQSAGRAPTQPNRPAGHGTRNTAGSTERGPAMNRPTPEPPRSMLSRVRR
jgi:hypothetical protein